MPIVTAMQSSYTDSDGYIPISEFAKLVGVSVSTVRRWDKEGLVTAVRTPTGHRRFRRCDVDTILKAGA